MRDRRLLVVVAHPDDESFGCGSVIALAASGGATVTVCCATRGDAGEPAASGDDAADLASVREAELRSAAAVLGAQAVVVLDFEDSGTRGEAAPSTLVGAPFERVVAAVEAVIAETGPDVVVTLDETGGDGHRDHVRIAAATTEAVRRRRGPHLYQWALARSLMHRWVEHLREGLPASEHLDLDVTTMGRPDGDLTTLLDVADFVPVRRAAMAEHRSQRSPYDAMPPDLQAAFLCTDRLVRIEPAWAGGELETALRWPAR